MNIPPTLKANRVRSTMWFFLNKTRRQDGAVVRNLDLNFSYLLPSLLPNMYKLGRRRQKTTNFLVIKNYGAEVKSSMLFMFRLIALEKSLCTKLIKDIRVKL